MKKDYKAIWLTVLVAAFGVAIGFLGELMPDDFKFKVQSWATAFGGSYLGIWISATALVVLLFLWLVWKEASKKENLDPKVSESEPETIENQPVKVQNDGATIKNQFNGGTFNNTTFN